MRKTREQFISELLALFNQHGQLTVSQAANLLGAHYETTRKRIETMRELKLLRICDYIYRDNNGMPKMVFGLGSEKDARPREKTIKGPEYYREYRKRLKEEQPDKHREKVLKGYAARKRRLSDPVKREEHRVKKMRYERKRRGYNERRVKPEVALDRIAMQFGITWRFKQSVQNAVGQ